LLGLNLDSFKFGLVFFGVITLCFWRVWDHRSMYGKGLDANSLLISIALGGVLLGMWQYFAMPGMLNIAIIYGIALVVRVFLCSNISWYVKIF